MTSPWLCECTRCPVERVTKAIEEGADLAELKARFGIVDGCGACLANVERLMGTRPSPWRRLGIPLLLAALFVGATTRADRWFAAGPANTGHEDLACGECHHEAAGTIRQQLQANVQHAMGAREDAVPLGFLAPDNQTCVECHDREGEDRHPPFRFREPRFEDARADLGPQYCTSCHQEHLGVRVTAPVDFCQHCHLEFEPEEDPIEPTHQALADAGAHEQCLGCHDFHGSHIYELPVAHEAAFGLEAVQAYLDGGASPYGEEKRFKDGRD